MHSRGGESGGEVVAVTASGVNDDQVLTSADVGLTMVTCSNSCLNIINSMLCLMLKDYHDRYHYGLFRQWRRRCFSSSTSKWGIKCKSVSIVNTLFTLWHVVTSDFDLFDLAHCSHLGKDCSSSFVHFQCVCLVVMPPSNPDLAQSVNKWRSHVTCSMTGVAIKSINS